jgi:D-lactate dehydrogenase
MPKIVFFEVASWEKEELKKNFPEALLVEKPLTEENVSDFADTEIASCFIYSNFSKGIIEKLPNLKLIATRSTGFDHIDVSFCHQKNITVCNVPEYGSRTVAEHTFALILTLTRKIYQSINQAKNFDFNHEKIRGVDLFGKTLGILGLGKIGKEMVKIAHGFGMRVLVYTRTQDETLAKTLGFSYKSLDEVLSSSDVVSLHLPLTDETKHIINKDNIKKIKKGAFLVNTARGGLIETEALVLGLKEGILAGAALDVLEGEKELMEETEILTESYQKTADLKTLILNHILINQPNVIITPHNAFNTKEALFRILETTIKNIQGFLKGEIINKVY